ncbi:MAG: hypothetical protein ACRC9T_06075 [Vibrionaceae bacterium]
MSKKLLSLMLLIASMESLAFNDDFSTISTSDVTEQGLLDSKMLANLPYSACELDDPAITDRSVCNKVSLRVGSKIFNKLISTKVIYAPTKITQDKAERINQIYKVASQNQMRRWRIPTLGQLQWMIDNKTVLPSSGEKFWVLSDDGRAIKQVFWKEFFTPAYEQEEIDASLYRLANELTPSVCAYGDCSNFVEKKPFWIVVRRNNIVHDMYAKVEYSDGKNVVKHEGWSARWTDIQIPPTVQWVNFTYSKAHASSEQKLTTQHDVHKMVNFREAQPTLCWISGGTVVSVTIGSSPHSMDYSQVGSQCN